MDLPRRHRERTNLLPTLYFGDLLKSYDSHQAFKLKQSSSIRIGEETVDTGDSNSAPMTKAPSSLPIGQNDLSARLSDYESIRASSNAPFSPKTYHQQLNSH